MNILEACKDPKLFGPWFRNPKSWQAWFAFLAALFALPMTEEQKRLFRGPVWNFLCLEVEIPHPGDWRLATVGAATAAASCGGFSP